MNTNHMNRRERRGLFSETPNKARELYCDEDAEGAP